MNKRTSAAAACAGDSISAAPVEVLEAERRSAVEQLAYELWEARGCPDGTPDEDWRRAEEQLGIREKD